MAETQLASRLRCERRRPRHASRRQAAREAHRLGHRAQTGRVGPQSLSQRSGRRPLFSTTRDSPVAIVNASRPTQICRHLTSPRPRRPRCLHPEGPGCWGRSRLCARSSGGLQEWQGGPARVPASALSRADQHARSGTPVDPLASPPLARASGSGCPEGKRPTDRNDSGPTPLFVPPKSDPARDCDGRCPGDPIDHVLTGKAREPIIRRPLVM